MTKKQKVELWRLHDAVTSAAADLVGAQRRKDEASAKFHDYLDSISDGNVPAKRKYTRKAAVGKDSLTTENASKADKTQEGQ